MKRVLPYGTLLALAFLVGLLARTPPDRMPQALAGGDDILSVLLGDAKKDISGAMLHEADSYFHGGVDMTCSALHDPHHDHGPHHDHDHDHDSGTAEKGRAERSVDPWRWINSHIRAPEIERHLSGDKSVEMMPWLWGAVEADPHNVKAWSAAWYTAFHMMKDERLALRIASDGWRRNPSSLELACALGRTYRADGTRDVEKSEAMFRTVVEMAGKAGELGDDDCLAFFNAVGYLADAAKTRRDAKDLAALREAARRVNPNHPTARFIGDALNEIKSAGGL